MLVSAGFLLHASVRFLIFDLILLGMWRLWMCVTDISDTWREGTECPSLLLLLITSHLPFPPPFILPPSHPHHSALLLSILRCATLPVLAVPHIKSPWLWCHCPFLSCRCGLICPLPLALSLSHSGPDKSPSLLPLLSSYRPYPFLLFLLFFPPSVCCSGLFTYGSTFLSATQGIPLTHWHHWHPCWGQPIGTDADLLHASAEHLRPRGERWKVTVDPARVDIEVKRSGERRLWGYKNNQSTGRKVLVTVKPEGQRWWHHMGSWGGRRGAWRSTSRRWKVGRPSCACVRIMCSVYIWALCCTSVCVCALTCMHECRQDSAPAFTHECTQ